MSDENNNKVRECLSSIAASAEFDATDAYLSSFPPGYRFVPTDEELIVPYLSGRVENKSLPANRINEVNLYNHTPEYLTSDMFKSYERVWYYYTSRDRKYPNGERPKRSAGDGYWKATGVGKDICGNDGTVIGSKKTLVFYRGKAPKGDKTGWIMDEFRIDKSKFEKNSRADMLLDNCVLCRIHNKITTTRPRTRRVAAAATTCSSVDPMEYSNEEEEEEERAMDMATTSYEPAAANKVHYDDPMSSFIIDHPNSLCSTSMMDPCAGTFNSSIFYDQQGTACIPLQTYPSPAPPRVVQQVNENYMYPVSTATATDIAAANFSTHSSSQMQWGGTYSDSSVFCHDHMQLDYNDMMSSLSVDHQQVVPHPPPPPQMQCGGNHDSLSSLINDREQVFRENDRINMINKNNEEDIYAAGWSNGSSTSANVIPDYFQDYTYDPDYLLP